MLLLKSRIFWAQFLTVSVVAAIQVYAEAHDLYYFIWWLDIPQHFMGGMWLAFVCFWLFAVAKRPTPTLLIVFLSVFAIGVAWEIYEFVFGISWGPMYVYDTAKDLLMDCLGGVTAYNIAHRFLLKKK